MIATEHGSRNAASQIEMQAGWYDLISRVDQLEADKAALEQENKALRLLLERVIEHRQRSHSELVLLLTNLVSRLPLSDIGAIVSLLVEHNSNVASYLAALSKGAAEAPLPQPNVLKTLDQTKRDITAAIKPVVDELLRLEAPFEQDALQNLPANPESFFLPNMIRASRCFVKGQVPRERILRQFGSEALVLFNDMTTDPKLNPRPKPDEIMLSFKSDFEALLEQTSSLSAEKKAGLLDVYKRVQQSKGTTDKARTMRNAFYRLSFLAELLHYYDHQNTEPADVTFAQRLPAVIEQLVLTNSSDTLDEAQIAQAEGLLGYVINPDHRQSIINNIGKGGRLGKTLSYVLRLRADKILEADHMVAEFLRLLIADKSPSAQTLHSVVRLVTPPMQSAIVKAILRYDRIRKDEALALGKALGKLLHIEGIEDLATKGDQGSVSPEVERQIAWSKIKDLIGRRSDPVLIANAIRERLHAKYDVDEVRQSWITLTEADPMTLIRVFCHLPYLANGTTDSIARPVMETYVSRLMHEKYATTYSKIINSLRNIFRAKADSPTLLNFTTLVRWVSPEAADKIGADAGLAAPAAHPSSS
jgi:hypothetical protein